MASKKWAVVPHDFGMSEFMGTGEPPIQIIDGDGNTVACNTTFYPTQITAEHAATIVAAVNEVAELREQLTTARAALQRLSTFEAMTTEGWGFAHPELTARVEYARTALTRKEPTNV